MINNVTNPEFGAIGDRWLWLCLGRFQVALGGLRDRSGIFAIVRDATSQPQQEVADWLLFDTRRAADLLEHRPFLGLTALLAGLFLHALGGLLILVDLVQPVVALEALVDQDVPKDLGLFESRDLRAREQRAAAVRYGDRGRAFGGRSPPVERSDGAGAGAAGGGVPVRRRPWRV